MPGTGVVTRRRALRTLAASGAVLLAGCGGPGDDPDGQTDDDPNENEQEDGEGENDNDDDNDAREPPSSQRPTGPR